MGQVSQAFRRSGVIPTASREGDASASSDSIFNAYAPEVSDQTGRPESPRLVSRPIGRAVVLTAVPPPASAATSDASLWASSVGTATTVDRKSVV